MKQYLKLFVSIGICFAVGFGIVTLNNGYMPQKTENSKHAAQNSEEISQNTIAAEVNTPPSQKDRYILKYDKEEGKITLTVKYKDGSEIISPVETINPYYLTKEDLDALRRGIELSSKEDMYILIEDYSS
jgi:hypothetical protein